ncbi:MAG: hypothetical protein EA350_05600 [Gemmatimonadales bacterium]|nr:MAG: hypothetical protein EA350_05600 [Gemmatimonadales bacterium]
MLLAGSLLAGMLPAAILLLAMLLAGPLPAAPAEGSLRPVPGDTAGSPGTPHVLVPDHEELAGRVRILYWDGSAGRAERTALVLARHAALPGLPPHEPVRAEVVLAPDLAAWDAYTGGQVPHWGAGVAIPSLDRIVLPLFRAPWSGGVSEDRTLRHEWAHLGLHSHLEGLRIPRWFDEGYAQWASGGWDATSGWRLRVALARGSAPPLQELTLAWPRDRQSAELAYLLSASAVTYLVEESGIRGMEVFLDRWQESRSFDRAFRETFGMSPSQFESRWIQHVRRRYGWMIFLSQTAFVWGILGVVLLVLFGIRRRRDRERLERLRRNEASGETPPTWWTPFS